MRSSRIRSCLEGSCIRSVSSCGSEDRSKYCSCPVWEYQIYLSVSVTIQWLEKDIVGMFPMKPGTLPIFRGPGKGQKTFSVYRGRNFGSCNIQESSMISRSSAILWQTEPAFRSGSTFLPAVMNSGIWQLPSYGRDFRNMW